MCIISLMKIALKRIEDRYGFDILDNSGKAICLSDKHYFLMPPVASSYKYAWEACRDAWKMSSSKNYHIAALKMSRYDLEEPLKVDVSAEEMLVEHYMGILRNLRLRAQGTATEKEDREKVYQETKAVITELESIKEKITDPHGKRKISKVMSLYKRLIDKYFKKEFQKEIREMEGGILPTAPSLPTASSKTIAKIASATNEVIDSLVQKELVEEYAHRVCRAIQDKHNDIYYVIQQGLDEIRIFDFNNDPILKIRINENLNVNSVVPVGKLYDTYPIHSVTFYQKYWKPIVEALGHICVGNPSVLILVNNSTLPDVPNVAGTYAMEGWNIDGKRTENVDISFRGDSLTWILEPASPSKIVQAKNVSKYTEQDYTNAIVKCIDRKLASIFGRTGSVIQIMPHPDYVEVDVDFGRGLDVVRLTEQQIEIVSTGA